MTEKIQQAIDKIDGEAENLNDVNARVIASHIIDKYLTGDENAEKVLNAQKTLSGFLSMVKKKAQDQMVRKGNIGVSMISDNTVFSWVKEYYGFAVDCKESKIIDLLDFI